MQNKVKLLKNDIIYVEKVGDQTERSMFELIGRINKISSKLRDQSKRVLILSNGLSEGRMDTKALKMAAKIGKEMDYDKSASYGYSPYMNNVREDMISETRLAQKVANFRTKDEALAWLIG